MFYDARPLGICQRSGFQYPLDELVREWTGLLVHHRFIDRRNEQDFVTGVRDIDPPRRRSPEPADVFLSAEVTQADL